MHPTTFKKTNFLSFYTCFSDRKQIDSKFFKEKEEFDRDTVGCEP